MKISPFSIGKVFLTLYLAVVPFFYFWTTSSNDVAFKFDFSPDQQWYKSHGFQEASYTYYNLLADAFLAGQLHLLIEPSQELLSSENPYDPEQHKYKSLLDASLYNNKYYFYFGPAPALTFFIPYKVLFTGRMPANFAAGLMAYGGVLFAYLLLLFFRDRFFHNVEDWLIFLGVISVSLCTFIPFALRRPSSYEIAILGAYFFSMGGMYFLLSGTFGKEIKNWKLVLGSIFLGLAVASRPVLMLAFPALALSYVYILQKVKEKNFKKTVPQLIFLIIPYSIIIFLLGLYNYLRFDNWLEFGQKWQLTLQNMREIELFSFSNLFPNLGRYLFKPVETLQEFPYFTIGFEHIYKDGFSLEPVTGILVTVPLVWLGLIFIISWKNVFRQNYALFLSLLAIACSAILILVFVSFYSAVTMRYAIDFTPFFVVFALLNWYYFYENVKIDRIEIEKLKLQRKLNVKKSKKTDKAKSVNNLSSFEKNYSKKRIILILVSIIAIAMISYSSVVNVLLSFRGYHDNLRQGNPELYQSLKDIF